MARTRKPTEDASYADEARAAALQKHKDNKARKERLRAEKLRRQAETAGGAGGSGQPPLHVQPLSAVQPAVAEPYDPAPSVDPIGIQPDEEAHEAPLNRKNAGRRSGQAVSQSKKQRIYLSVPRDPSAERVDPPNQDGPEVAAPVGDSGDDVENIDLPDVKQIMLEKLGYEDACIQNPSVLRYLADQVELPRGVNQIEKLSDARAFQFLQSNAFKQSNLVRSIERRYTALQNELEGMRVRADPRRIEQLEKDTQDARKAAESWERSAMEGRKEMEGLRKQNEELAKANENFLKKQEADRLLLEEERQRFQAERDEFSRTLEGEKKLRQDEFIRLEREKGTAMGAFQGSIRDACEEKYPDLDFSFIDSFRAAAAEDSEEEEEEDVEGPSIAAANPFDLGVELSHSGSHRIENIFDDVPEMEINDGDGQDPPAA